MGDVLVEMISPVAAMRMMAADDALEVAVAERSEREDERTAAKATMEGREKTLRELIHEARDGAGDGAWSADTCGAIASADGDLERAQNAFAHADRRYQSVAKRAKKLAERVLELVRQARTEPDLFGAMDPTAPAGIVQAVLLSDLVGDGDEATALDRCGVRSVGDFLAAWRGKTLVQTALEIGDGGDQVVERLAEAVRALCKAHGHAELVPKSKALKGGGKAAARGPEAVPELEADPEAGGKVVNSEGVLPLENGRRPVPPGELPEVATLPRLPGSFQRSLEASFPEPKAADAWMADPLPTVFDGVHQLDGKPVSAAMLRKTSKAMAESGVGCALDLVLWIVHTFTMRDAEYYVAAGQIMAGSLNGAPDWLLSAVLHRFEAEAAGGSSRARAILRRMVQADPEAVALLDQAAGTTLGTFEIV